MELDKNTLEYVFSSQTTVIGRVNAPWGHDDVALDLEGFQRYTKDYTQFCADHYKLTLAQYDRWIETHGTPQCGEITKSGKRCKKSSGQAQSNAEDWLENDGGICAYHERQTWNTKYS